MESNWRSNVEGIGWGGPIYGFPFPLGQSVRFAAQLNPPLLTAAGVCTWIVVSPRMADGFQTWMMGNLDTLGYFTPKIRGVKPNAVRFPFPGWNVLPD